jgi:glycosyltransferase involved in cell wall biosynthesis
VTLSYPFTAEQGKGTPQAGSNATTGPPWLQVMSHLSPRYGGIASSVPRLARATEDAGLRSCPIVGFCDAEELAHISQEQRVGAAVFPTSRLRWMVDSQLQRSFKNTIRASSGVHIHGIWETHSMVAAALARDCKRPYVISAHGMLEPWALRHKRLKKAAYAALVEIRNMKHAACLRALSVDEGNDYRRLGLTAPIAIIPNGVEPGPAVSCAMFLNAYPKLASKRIVLFLGRLHHKKGLHMLLKAWALVVPKVDDLHLVIAGPDSEDTLASLKELHSSLKIQSSVTFAGMLNGEEKWSALAAASVFVLPSYSEGFSVAVLEALSMAVPVIVSSACHIPEVETAACGWVISPDGQRLERALVEYAALSAASLAQMGKQGEELVRRRFTSSVVGKQMSEVYDWLEGGNRPASVETS